VVAAGLAGIFQVLAHLGVLEVAMLITELERPVQGRWDRVMLAALEIV
jgi:hypothetical protein